MFITMIALAAALAGGTTAAVDHLGSLAEAERAFARHCVKDGVRASFLVHFAPDGIVLAPAPTNALALYGARPAPAARPPVTLDWEPVAGDVAASGDLGWTAGPYTLRDDTGAKPTAHGHYLSVWKRQADATWKVVADAGTENPAPSGERPAFARASSSPSVTGAVAREEVLALDREAGRGCATGDCLAERLDDGARVHRPGALPIVGASAARTFLRAQAPRAFEPEGGEASSAGDLAYTWGRSRATGADGRADADGVYIHVWRRTPAGWRLQAEIAKPAEPAPKP